MAGASFLVLAAACGGGDSNDVEPELIPGGGVGSGAIAGEVNIFVIDSQTDQAIGGATVRVGEAEDAQPLTGTTDSSGLVTFTDVSGPQVITVTAADHAAATWFGANGANVTIPLEPTAAATVESAHTAGTIMGWDTMTPPATMNHYLVAFVFYSLTDEIGAPENNLSQGNPPRNVCLKAAGLPDPGCSWELTSRTGSQAHYAMILDGDSKGTLTNFDDDTFTLIGFAFKGNLTLDAGQDVAGEVLVPVDMTALTTLNVTFPAAPAGLGTVQGVPLINLGAQGQVALVIPPLGPTMTMTQVPALSGDLAGASYDLFARATPSATDQIPSSTTFLRSQDLTAPVSFPAWLPTPSDVTAAQGTYSFGAAAGASVHVGEFRDSTGTVAWNVSLLDGRTVFTLPTLAPDALPTGDVTLVVNALAMPSFDPMDFSVDELIPTVSAASDNSTMFTH